MAEPALDLSEIIDLYKEDARRMVGQMKEALSHWTDIQTGGTARQDMRRLSHQLRGSGRTYGFREVTRICKAIENITHKLEKGKLPANDRIQGSLRKKVELLAATFNA